MEKGRFFKYMSHCPENKDAPLPVKSRGKSLLLSLPMLAITSSMLAGKASFASDGATAAYFISLAFLNFMFYKMVRSGKTDKYRAIVFITLAGAAAFSFMSFFLELRGAFGVTPSEIMRGEVPACHMVLPMLFLPALFSKTVVFPGLITGGFASIAVLAVFWAAASLVIGKGYCSWFCFLGGFEDGFSRIFKSPVIKSLRPDLRLLPFAVLLTAVLTSAYTLTHTYCEWVCPYKMVTEFEQVVSLKLLVQSGIFIFMFAALVVVLPLLTKVRAQCAFFCPFGAMQTLAGRLAPFEIRIDTEKCSRCGKCLTECPDFSLDKEALEKGKPRISCHLCGKCVDLCPDKAIFFHVKGTSLKTNLEAQRVLFLYPAYTFLAAITGMNLQQALLRVFNFFS